jgi:putative peptide zinc metalloprotease protein
MAAPAFASPPPAAPAPLPAMRAELQLLDGPLDLAGRPSVQIFDPVRNAYFRLGWPASAAIRAWRPGDAAAFANELRASHAADLSLAELDEIAEFLFRNELSVADRQNSWKGLAAKKAQAQHGNLALKIAHNYLFFRIPLLNPDRMLERVAPAFDFVMTRGFAFVFGGAMLLALFLILRQWDAFAASAASALTTESLPAYAALLVALKGVHEMGHAIVAKRLGCRVPSMGVALMLGAPVLYTDTTDAWRLTQRWKRLSVTLAGVGAEMIVAGLALLAWSFLPVGAPRQMACALATMSVVTSLTLNLNPCMRFDGYFALSDLLDVPNLQDRAFALTRAHLRHTLLGLPMEAAPDLAPSKARLLVIYGYATWIYRIALYTGVAALVYMMSFKALGLLLFAFEIVWFILRPLWSEARVWWVMRGNLATNARARWSAGAFAVALILVLLPWSRVVEAPGVRVARDEASVHARMAARVEQVLVRDGAEVAAGQILARLEAPVLEAQRRRARAEIAALEARLARAPAMDSERDSILVLSSQLASSREKLAGLDRLDEDLEIRAPIGGIVVDLEPGLRAGVWINQGQELARVVAPQGVSVRALVEEADVRRIAEGASAVFIPEAGLGARTPLRVVAIAESNERQLADPALADVNGGPVAVNEERAGFAPRAALFAVTLESGAPAPVLLERGAVRIAAAGESPLARAMRRVAQVLTRESGF